MKKAKPNEIRSLIDQGIQLAGGTQQTLADAVGMSQHAIYHARKVGRVSAELAIKIDKFTDGKISSKSLRPDLFR